MLNSAKRPQTRAVVWICIALASITFACYQGVFSAQYLDYDDDYYVVNNPHVHAGLTLATVRWAVTSREVMNWHPLTWCSHALDYTLFGLDPKGPHIENLVLHIANSILLFLLLRRLTGALWRSAFVAALFALHPLHVESVAWVAERKDVLSTLLLFLCIWAYANLKSVEGQGSMVESGAKRPNEVSSGPRLSTLDSRPTFAFGLCTRYALVLLLFALALMAKPMVVTLPCLLLLLDFWPLNRLRGRELDRKAWGKLILEKVPLFIVAAGSCMLTVWAQTIATTAELPMKWRVLNALLSYGRYLLKTLWPVRLYVNYPYPLGLSLWYPLGAAAILTVISIYAVRAAKQRPYFFAGWFWYVGLLVPVIGIVQVGIQSMADRYTYVPLIGIFIIAAWGGCELVESGRVSAIVARVGAILVIAACVPLTSRQVRVWHDSTSLFEHALKMDPDNIIVENNLAVVCAAKGDLNAAMAHLKNAIRINPYYPETYANVGQVQLWQQKYRDAIDSYNIVLRADPDRVLAHYGMGVALEHTGRSAEAEEHFQTAIRLNPGMWAAQDEYGLLLENQGRHEEALAQFDAALRIKPGSPLVHLHRADVLAQMKRPGEAIAEYRALLKTNPDLLDALNNLAWILASDPNPANRNGLEAVRLAEHACELTKYKGPVLLGTLAAAYAEAGRFDDAVATAQKAVDLATASGRTEVAEHNRKLVELYRAHKAFHED